MMLARLFSPPPPTSPLPCLGAIATPDSAAACPSPPPAAACSGSRNGVDGASVSCADMAPERVGGGLVAAAAAGVAPDAESVRVALKTVKADASEREMLDLLRELELMKYIGKHENIINLIGCCTQTGQQSVLLTFMCSIL